MRTLVRGILGSKLIFLISFSCVFAASLEPSSEASSAPIFSVRHSPEYHPRLNGLLSLSLVNTTQNSLSSYRIFAMIKKNIHEPFIPGNITEHIWRFVGDDDEVVLPLGNLGFTLVIFQGDFDGVRPDREVIDNDNSQKIFMLHGEEVEESVRSLQIIVR